jgi:transglycosylase-like protein with SLT domain
MTVQAIGSVVEAAIQRASSATGVDFRFLLHTARRESGCNPSAKARTSSATGLFQFTQQTWLATLKQHGAKYGYARYADQIQQGAGGRYHVAGEARAAVMDLRLDPHASALMAGELAADHAAYLRGRVGREPTAGELYAAHVLGSQGSARLIDAVGREPGATAAALFPDAAGANRGIFYPGGHPATVAQVYANLTSLGGDGGVAAPAAAATDLGLIQDPTLRDEGRQEEEALVAMILRGPDGGAGDNAFGSLPAGGMFSTEMLRALSESTRS